MFSDSRQLVARTERLNSARLMASLPSRPGRSRRHRGPGLGVDPLPELAVLDEGVEVLPEDLGGLDQGHFRRERAVGPDLDGQLVVVGLLADAGLLDLVPHAGHRAVGGVDRDDADLLDLGAVLGGGDVSAAVLDDHLHEERHVVGHRGQDVVLVDHLDLLVGAARRPR